MCKFLARLFAFLGNLRHNRLMPRAYKYRLYPTAAQETQLNRQLELCRWVYNKTLETRKRYYEQNGATLGYYDTKKMLPLWKAEKSDLAKVNAQVLQDVVMRVDLAFKAFFRRVQSGAEKPGYPRFKGQGRYDSLCFPQYGSKGCVRLDGGKLHLSKIGGIKIKLHRVLCGTPKTVCVRRSFAGKWFATIVCESDQILLGEEIKVVGVDVGLATFATLSDGSQIKNPRFFKRDARQLAKAQRRLAKVVQVTPERKRRVRVVERVHERIANRRTNFAHEVSRQLVNNYGVIVFEKLAVVEMLGRHKDFFGNKLNRGIADAAWSQLAQFTAYKAEDAGRLFLQVDPRNTSKKCSRCGLLVDKDLSVRVHDCPHCGLVIDRDQNAAINILALGLQRMGQIPRSSQPLAGE